MTIASKQLKTTPSGEDGTNQANYVQVGILIESNADNLTAHAGGGQANALPLLNEVNRITTVATSGDSVALPKSYAGMTVLVINHGANPMQVFGYGSGAAADAIDDSGATVGVSQMQSSVVLYICATAGSWYSEGLGTGFVAVGGGNFQTFSSVDGLVASTIHSQAGGTPITASQAGFGTVANAGDCGTLPPTKVGLQIDVINHGAQNMSVYPASAAQGGVTGGDQINSLGANQPLTGITNTTPTIFYCLTAGQWWTK
jgi:hypothetical protein